MVISFTIYVTPLSKLQVPGWQFGINNPVQNLPDETINPKSELGNPKYDPKLYLSGQKS